MLPIQPFVLDRLHANRRQELVEVAELARLRRACLSAAPARPPHRLRWPALRLPHWLTQHAQPQRPVSDAGMAQPAVP